jgi:hypothetical protein
MSPLLKVVLLVAVVAAAWWLVTTYRASRGTAGVRFTPVEELAPEVRATIDAALSRGELLPAIHLPAARRRARRAGRHPLLLRTRRPGERARGRAPG